MNFQHCFTDDYSEAKAMFADASCVRAGARRHTYTHPLDGPNGVELRTDVTVIGAESPRQVLVLISGTHGVEGLCGAACQTAWLESGAYQTLPPGLAVAIVHYLNPHGGAWLRRETEDNVDLNRNFVDHSVKMPRNVDYASLHDALMLRGVDGDGQGDVDLQRVRSQMGESRFLRGLSAGQYEFPDGLYYGGDRPMWSNITLRGILQRVAGAATDVAIIDVHTGLGSFGEGVVLSLESSTSTALPLQRHWYGPRLLAPLAQEGEPFIAPTGHCFGAVAACLPNARVVPTCVEYGTFEPERDIAIHRQENWWWRNGQLDTPVARRIKADFVHHFFPDTRPWRAMVLEHWFDMVTRTIRGLTEL